MLTAAELALLQATQNLTLIDACTVTRRTLSSDSAGGHSATWATAATTVCRVAPARENERLLAGQQRIVAEWKVTLPASTDVRDADRIVVGARSFEVIGIRVAETRETARVCLCQER